MALRYLKQPRQRYVPVGEVGTGHLLEFQASHEVIAYGLPVVPSRSFIGWKIVSSSYTSCIAEFAPLPEDLLGFLQCPAATQCLETSFDAASLLDTIVSRCTWSSVE